MANVMAEQHQTLSIKHKQDCIMYFIQQTFLTNHNTAIKTSSSTLICNYFLNYIYMWAKKVLFFTTSLAAS